MLDEHQEQPLKKLLEQRRRELKAEFESGQKMLAKLETRQANLRETLLRISGAIQVLEELLAQPSPAAPDDPEPPEGVEEASPIFDEAAAPAL
jgi:predicted nuclease with TOPRIM domain